MEVASTIAEMRAIRRVMGRAKRGLGDVGFVPTLGYLHDGHLSLVRAAKEQNEHTIASIFVNPTQFNNPGDFERYPRDDEGDLAQLRDQGVDALFMPSAEEMYPAGQSTSVDVQEVTERLEGEHRPGHFRGVATVVAKLFNVVQPTRAYFGRKDAQQLVVIRRMVRDLHMGVEIVGMPTIREPDGLAMSSRNARLSPAEREAALALSKALRLAAQRWQGGERSAARIRDELQSLISREPLARVDYVSVADTETLEELDSIEGEALVSLAVHIGEVRLIDNITLPSQVEELL
ncbi:MAG: pantoate--beta-alanine ligase [Chloroflexi bacterium]|nr:pantoate--beta-alanine ligase [Chloroflexota bacterium]